MILRCIQKTWICLQNVERKFKDQEKPVEIIKKEKSNDSKLHISNYFGVFSLRFGQVLK